MKTTAFINIPKEKKNIDDYEFKKTGIRFLSLKKNIKKIGYNAFVDTPLEVIFYEGEEWMSTEIEINNEKNSNLNVEKAIWIYGCNSVVNVENTDMSYILVNDKDVYLYKYNKDGDKLDLATVFKDYNLKYIAANTFKDSKFTSISIPDTTDFIGAGAFMDSKHLQSVKLPESIPSITTGLFKNCKSLTSIVIPKSTTLIKDFAFSGCKKLQEITMYNTIIKIFDNAFKDCGRLKTINYYGKDKSSISIAPTNKALEQASWKFKN